MNRRNFAQTISVAAAAATLRPIALFASTSVLSGLASPVLFAGNAREAFRDPAAVFHKGWFYLYFTLIRKEDDGIVYSYLAWSRSKDLRRWTTVRTLTPRDKSLEFGSPGDVVQRNGQWVLCLQTYPRPHGERYGTRDSRLWTMRSRDLEHWDEPVLLKVKGEDVPRESMGRMIDPFLLRDKSDPDLWWCFYKQGGISLSRSNDLNHWTYVTKVDAGENPCVLVDGQEYVLFHSPPNGIATKRSSDLLHWRDEALTTLGQEQWDWAKGRITAGFVLDLRHDHRIGKAVMFFHASQFAEEDPRGGFDNFASIGIAWSDDLRTWNWPGKEVVRKTL